MLGFSGFVMTANDGCALLAVLRPATAGRRRGQGVRGMGGMDYYGKRRGEDARGGEGLWREGMALRWVREVRG